MKDHISILKILLQKNSFSNPVEIKELPSSGSSRVYFRILFPDDKTILAAFNDDVEENIAWNTFSKHFKTRGFKVPKVFARDESYQYFLMEDLGSEDLFGLLLTNGEEKVTTFFKTVIEDLLRFQTEGAKNLDFDVAYPVKQFDHTSILWDLNYFKYYFIKTHNIIFNERKLEINFQQLTKELLKPNANYFMYRDFQSRNIMIHNDEPWYIDFQGGRKGPLPYDLVSLLFQAKAKLSPEFRTELYELYLEKLGKILPQEVKSFQKSFPLFVLFRLMQVLGAYGYRGLIQRKGHFLSSIPFAIKNINPFLNENFQTSYPELAKVLSEIADLPQYQKTESEDGKLTVSISSFSYIKNGYPLDLSENRGGFVFDCRALPNPGRIVELRDFNGTQAPIIDYLSKQVEVDDFLENIFKIVDQSVANYIEREFTHLSVNFGCTGGKHRSVYSAEKLKTYLSKYGDKLTINLKHIQQHA